MKNHNHSCATVLFLLVVFLLSACQGGASAATFAPIATNTLASTVTPTLTKTPDATTTAAPSSTPDPFFLGNGTLKSGDGQKEVSLKFVNKMDELLLINWINFNGDEEPFTQVSPGASITQSTYSTHAWIVRDPANNIIAQIVATTADLQVFEIGADKQIAYQPTPLPAPTFGPDVPTTEHAYADRPDDTPHEYQIHILYVLPADAQDRQLDLDGKLNKSIERLNNWFFEQSGGSKLRFDTYQGQLDITYVKLDLTNAEFYANTLALYNGDGEMLREYLELQLEQMQVLHPGKVYVTFFDINKHPRVCGSGAHPPDLMGRVAGLYYAAILQRDGFNCKDLVLGSNDGYTDFVILHELLHTIGYATSCGKHPTTADNTSHTGDDNRDLMWAPKVWGSAEPWDVDHMLLDPGHDDYFMHTIPNCPDLAKSVFLDPTPANAEPPLGWPAEWLLP